MLVGGLDTNSVCQFSLPAYTRTRIGVWFASGMASADAYDWGGDSYADLARAHELPIPTIESR